MDLHIIDISRNCESVEENNSQQLTTLVKNNGYHNYQLNKVDLHVFVLRYII